MSFAEEQTAVPPTKSLTAEYSLSSPSLFSFLQLLQQPQQQQQQTNHYLNTLQLTHQIMTKKILESL